MQSGSNGRHRRSARYDAPIQRPAAVPDSVPSSTMARQDAGQPAQPYYPQTNWPAPPAGYTQRGYGQQQGSQAQPAGQAMPGSQAMPAAQTAPVQPYYYQQQPQSQWTQPAYGGGGNGGTPPRQPSGGKSGGKHPPKKNRPGSFILSLLRWAVIVVIAGGVIAVALHFGQESMQKQQAEAYVTSYNDKFIHGVYVDGIHLGGMTLQEGTDAVVQQAQQRNDNWYVRLMYGGSVVLDLRASHLGMTTNVTDAIQQAWKQGHEGTMEERLIAMEKKLTQPFEAYTALPSGDTSVIDGLLDEIAKKVYRAPVDAQLVAFHPELTDPNTIFEISQEVQGRYLDTSSLKEQIYQMVSSMTSGELEIVPTALEPSITEAQIRQTVSLRAEASTKINYKSTEERTNNIRRSFELISGTVLLPGEKFSFNDIVGKRSTANGFFPAIEYAYGEQVIGVGGGVCQASSTIYIAAVRAALEITDREPHSMEVNYTDYGKDATVNLDGKKIDFQFRNNTDAPLYIVASVRSDPKNRKEFIAHTAIYGLALEEGVSYELVTETVEILPVPLEPTYKTDKTGEIVKYKDQEKQTFKGKEGCVVQSWMVKYVDGQEVERKELYKDTYKAQPIVIYRGNQNR